MLCSPQSHQSVHAFGYTIACFDSPPLPPPRFSFCLKAVYEEEQRGYYILSSFWAELDKDQVLGEPATVRTFDMHTCTLEDVQVTIPFVCLFLFAAMAAGNPEGRVDPRCVRLGARPRRV